MRSGSKKADIEHVTSFYVMDLNRNNGDCHFSVKASIFLKLQG